MIEESLNSMWTSMNSWFTPTVLFILLNLMIVTIAIVSKTQKHHHHHREQQEQTQLARTPSVLQRLKSIDLYRHRYQELNPFSSITTIYQSLDMGDTQQTLEPTIDQEQQEQTQLARVPSVLQRLKSIDLYHHRYQELNPFSSITTIYQSLDMGGTQQTLEPTIDQNPVSIPDQNHLTKKKSEAKTVNLPQKMKKWSSSSKLGFGDFEEKNMVERRCSSVRDGKVQTFGEDEGIDAKADDFINRFK